MSFDRIKVILLYSWYHLTHSMETWIDLFWFTTIEVIVFGSLAVYLGRLDQLQSIYIIIGLLLWEIVRIVQYGVSIGLLWDIWSRCLSSLFTTPLRVGEFLIAQILAGLAKTLMVLFFVSIICALFFKISILQLDWYLVIYCVELMAFSVAAGLLISAMIFRFGTDIQSLAWGLIFLVQPISALFYPVAVLPAEIRWVAFLSPITFVMESVRSQLSTGQVLWNYLGFSTLLNIFYLLLSLMVINKTLSWSKKTGAFARLES